MATMVMKKEKIKIATKNINYERSVSRNGVVYFPFSSEKETVDWLEDVASEWWDDEAI
ncbi:MAG: hypothetical protein LBC85_09675 [Fibromonadaceae bacterium]|nr:hypothetical protein [Fibromonadaceae bacterium]